MIKQGNLRAEKIKYKDGVGCSIWHSWDEDCWEVCFDFTESDLPDMIELLKKLCEVDPKPFDDEPDEDEMETDYICPLCKKFGIPSARGDDLCTNCANLKIQVEKAGYEWVGKTSDELEKDAKRLEKWNNILTVILWISGIVLASIVTTLIIEWIKSVCF